MSHLGRLVADVGPLTIIAAIAGAASFTHIHDTAAEHGQSGWMAWAVAVCIDLLAVMAAREIQRDMRAGRRSTWPVLVLAAGAILSLAANLAQSEPSPWGRVVAGTPAGAFLVAISMVERRARTNHASSSALGIPSVGASQTGPAPAEHALMPPIQRVNGHAQAPVAEPIPVPDALLGFARRIAEEHQSRNGHPATAEHLRARLGVSRELAESVHAQLSQGGTP
jgi:hypothetical protein